MGCTWEQIRKQPATWSRAVAYLWLLLMFAAMLTSATQKSPTMDEANHLTRGLAFLRTGDPRLSFHHPPLINLWAALPVALDPAVQIPIDSAAWRAADWNAVSDRVVWDRGGAAADAMIAVSRVPVMLLALGLGALVYRWAQEMHGPLAALLALTLYAFDPNLLAHARLNTTDLGVTAFVFAAGYAAWQWQRRPPRPGATLLTGGLMGLALASKSLAAIFVCLFGLVMLVDRRASQTGQRPLLARLRRLVVMLATALLVLWAAYGFSFDSPWPGVTARWPLGLYLRGLVNAGGRASVGHATFLLGRSGNGFWYYFPVAFLVKTPLPTLLLAAVAFALSLRGRSFPDEALLILPGLGYFMVLMLSSFNLGYRHLLPTLPFLFVQASKTARWLRGGPPVRRALTALMPVWLIAASLAIYPHYLAYFNEAAGGPANGYKILVDSNLDWGQDLPGLKAYLQREGIDRIKMSYFGPERPDYLGIDYEPLPGVPPTSHLWRDPPFDPQNPGPGVYAISVSNLQEIFFTEKKTYAWFRAREPDARIGHSIHVYRVER
jgi:4-amino-4-deoxy-L-arabinose transferase-like glycosyltransferase